MLRPDVAPAQFIDVYFGRKNSLDILAAVLSHTVEPLQPFRTQDIFVQVQETHQRSTAGHATVGKELRVMTALGMVNRGEKQGAAVPYTRADSLWWPVVERALTETRAV
jgi:hypothetical protein